MAHIGTENPPGLDRDDLYYFDDGDCVLRVENQLFKLHRFVLRRHSVFFRSLFSLPQSNNEQDGTDQRPILCDDSIEAFRAWCWILYAGLQEFEISKESDSFTEERFTHIGSLAHKYECEVIEQWARQKLDVRINQYLSKQRPGTLEISTSTPPAGRLEYVIRISTRCNWPSTKMTAETVLLATCMHDGAGQSSGVKLRSVIDVADNLNDNLLKSRAYYTFLNSIQWNPCPSRRSDARNLGLAMDITHQAQVWWDSLEALTDAQKVCLYRGFSVLNSLRERLCLLPRVDKPSCSCTSFLLLLGNWERSKKELTGIRGPKEFLEKMKCRALVGLPVVCGNECGLKQVRNFVTQFLEGFDDMLAQIFSD